MVGYLRFLQESRIVWDRLESIIAESDDPNCVLLLVIGVASLLRAFVLLRCLTPIPKACILLCGC